MNGYQKIKFIINEFLKKRAVSARDSIFEYNGISIDTVQNAVLPTILSLAVLVRDLHAF
mgnify:CR=1 FL=1